MFAILAMPFIREAIIGGKLYFLFCRCRGLNNLLNINKLFIYLECKNF